VRPQDDVNNQQLSKAIAGTSTNSNGVETLASNADQTTIMANLNELITPMRRL
jgi:hypothetical protein